MSTATVTLNFNCELDDEQLETILETAAWGIGYWTKYAEIIDTADEDSPDAAAALILKTWDEDHLHIIDRFAVQNAIIHALNRAELPGFSGAAREDLTKAIINEEPDNIDAETANQLIQIACFNEVLYA